MKRVIRLALSAVLSLVITLPTIMAVQAMSAALMSPNKQIRRLPLDVLPVAYQLSIAPQLEAATFQGDEMLDVDVAAGGAGAIVLNSKDLKISAVRLRCADANIAVTVHDAPADSVVEITPAQPLKSGRYQLQMHFSGKLNDQLVGFYRSTFKDAAGKQHWLAVTQMEPTDARRMFPCFDEPAFKATFKLTVRAGHGLTAVTNAPLEHQINNSDGTSTFEFAATPRMSSYLVALAVGELEATDPVIVDGVPIRVWSVIGKKHLGEWTRDEAAKILPVLTNYFGIAYPWKKLDLLAIPDFEAGAMENPGAITFRETLLLIDPKTASSFAKHSACSVVAHEMAHLWFGDLVTMQWWDDLWLNEAFATWMATKTVDRVHPDWQEWKGYCEDRSESMMTDGLLSTRAIHSDVTDPDKTHEMFDVITYSKGASILRMLERYVSEKTFQQGVHDYLVKHSFANATTGDLWAAIASASATPVPAIMQGWVHQPGYPMLTLKSLPEGGYNVRQQRFLETGMQPGDSTLWQVPVGLRMVSGAVAQSAQTEPQSKQLVTASEAALTPPADVSGTVLLANAGGVGYYRSKYPDAVYDQLTKCVDDQLDPSERLTLLDDTWALAETGEVSIDQALNMMHQWRNDRHELVAGRIIEVLAELDNYVDEAQRPAFEKFVQRQLAPLYSYLGWQAKADETQQTRMLRAEVLTSLGTIGQDSQVIAQARQYYRTLVGAEPGSNGGIDADLMGPISFIVGYNGDKQEFDFFKQRYQKARTPEEEHRNLFALGAFRKPELVGAVLDMSTDGSVRTQDAVGLLAGQIRRHSTGERAWAYVESHWPRITLWYPEEMVPHLVAAASSFNTRTNADRVKAFVSTHHIPFAESTTARTLERMQIHVAFRERSAARFNEWLKSH